MPGLHGARAQTQSFIPSSSPRGLLLLMIVFVLPPLPHIVKPLHPPPNEFIPVPKPVHSGTKACEMQDNVCPHTFVLKTYSLCS